ncbi:MAG: universal stress protein [Haloarculaceae archaeon]
MLAPVDTDELRVNAQVEAISSLPEAADAVAVTLLYVFESEEVAETTDVSEIHAVAMARDRLLADGIAVETETEQGDPATEILETADRTDADLIVLGGRKRSPLGSFLFGSVSQAVLLETTRPVVITGERELDRSGADSPASAE